MTKKWQKTKRENIQMYKCFIKQTVNKSMKNSKRLGFISLVTVLYTKS